MELWALAQREATLKYHPGFLTVLTVGRISTGHGTMSGGQFDWGGRLPRVTEAHEGTLRLSGNQP